MSPIWLLVVAVLIGAIDWYAVGTDNRRLEYVAKPLTMVPLIAYAMALDPSIEASRWWFVAALFFSLAGDVFLMLPSDRFVEGLGSFLVGHVAYVGGMAVWGLSIGVVWWLVLVGILAALASVGRAIVTGAGREDRRLRVPVAAYVGVITAMVLAAAGTDNAWFLLGALLFYASDASIGVSRFIREFPFHRVVIMTTYHGAQFLLVHGLTVDAAT